MRFPLTALAAFCALLTALPAFAQSAGRPMTLREAGAVRIWVRNDGEPDRSPRWLDEAVDREAKRLARRPAAVPALTQSSPKRGWIKRHPILTGALIGFGTGFVIGYSQGDDGVLYDFTAMFNGVFLGWVGAGVGAGAGAILK